MNWPTPQEYSEALQTPAVSFEDADLRRGQPALNRHGLPLVSAGGFATVYRVRTGTEDHAVRCFLTSVADQRERYAAISAHLAATRLPQAVEFTYLDRGILVQGRWYPVLKMDWVHGETLEVWLEKHRQDGRATGAVTLRFVELLRCLNERQIAHGDLQHGNLLVVDEGGEPRLRLIDYDGMWVPALAGRPGTELGHRNYQHPLRTHADFGPNLDAFSAWSILTSLIGVNADPSLWSRARTGDEQLLLAKSDYQEPWRSAAVDALQRANDPRVRLAVDGVVTYALAAGPSAVASPLTSIDQTVLAPPASATARQTAVSAGSGAVWWQESAAAAPSDQAPAPIALPWWVAAPTPVSIQRSLWPDRVVLGLTIGLAVFAAIAAVQDPASAGLAIAIVLVATGAATVEMAAFYLRTPGVAAWRRLSRDVTAAKGARRAAESERRRNAQRAEREERPLADAARSAQNRLLAVETKAQRESADVDASLAGALSRIDRRRSALLADQGRRMSQALQALQTATLAARLNQQVIALQSGRIYGLGPTLTARLAAYGIRTASDFVGVTSAGRLILPGRRVISVPGIGASKAFALEAWRRSVEAQVRMSLPSRLPPGDVQQIEAVGRREKDELDRLEATERREAALKRANIAAAADVAKAAAHKELASAERALAAARAAEAPRTQAEDQAVRAADLEVARRELAASAYATFDRGSYVQSIVLGRRRLSFPRRRLQTPSIGAGRLRIAAPRGRRVVAASVAVGTAIGLALVLWNGDFGAAQPPGPTTGSAPAAAASDPAASAAASATSEPTLRRPVAEIGQRIALSDAWSITARRPTLQAMPTGGQRVTIPLTLDPGMASSPGTWQCLTDSDVSIMTSGGESYQPLSDFRVCADHAGPATVDAAFEVPAAGPQPMELIVVAPPELGGSGRVIVDLGLDQPFTPSALAEKARERFRTVESAWADAFSTLRGRYPRVPDDAPQTLSYFSALRGVHTRFADYVRVIEVPDSVRRARDVLVERLELQVARAERVIAAVSDRQIARLALGALIEEASVRSAADEFRRELNDESGASEGLPPTAPPSPSPAAPSPSPVAIEVEHPYPTPRSAQRVLRDWRADYEFFVKPCYEGGACALDAVNHYPDGTEYVLRTEVPRVARGLRDGTVGTWGAQELCRAERGYLYEYFAAFAVEIQVLRTLKPGEIPPAAWRPTKLAVTAPCTPLTVAQRQAKADELRVILLRLRSALLSVRERIISRDWTGARSRSVGLQRIAADVMLRSARDYPNADDVTWRSIRKIGWDALLVSGDASVKSLASNSSTLKLLDSVVASLAQIDTSSTLWR